MGVRSESRGARAQAANLIGVWCMRSFVPCVVEGDYRREKLLPIERKVRRAGGRRGGVFLATPLLTAAYNPETRRRYLASQRHSR